MANEIVEYRAIPGLPEWYRVGDDGSIWSRTIQGSTTTRLGKWRRLKTNPSNNGYRTIKYQGKVYRVHRLVMLAFVGPCPVGMEVRHLNGRTDDNRLKNLAYGTPKENQQDRIAHGTDQRGEKNGKAKLSPKDVQEIRRRADAGEPRTRICIDYSVNKWMIGEIAKRRSWRHIPEVAS